MTARPLQPITNLLIRRVFKWVFLCIVVFSSLQAWLNYKSIEKNFDVTVRDVASTHLPLLALAVWDIEPKAIQKQILLITKNTLVGYVKIKSVTGQEFSTGNANLIGKGQQFLFDIPAPTDASKIIGSMELIINRNILHQELVHHFLIIFLGMLVLTAFILGAVVMVLRQDLERPMRQLADFVKNLHANQMSNRLELQLAPDHQYSEIALVINGFQTMQDSIQKHISQQDALVQERTIQLQTAMNSLKKLSVTDSLTGCYNRLLFNERMPGEIRRAVRYQRALSVIFCDVDFFKSVNDQHGHAVGDKILIAFGQCLKDELREQTDWVVRYGGEEFVVVLPETPLHAAIEAAERMRRSVESNLADLNFGGKALSISASFGVAEKSANDTLETLVQRADQWLYFAKNNGRNQVQPTLKDSEQVASSVPDVA
ncbi:GGDEF domain-containing protein [Undibacterium sp. SXout7W]|uniref:GGDEF domain-containing protein n=1 Tax=Undibacterium sp. SXout7W TaxID=3413049 RepID=UPI003BEF8D41